MKINVFGKKRTSKEGRTFYTYLTTLAKTDDTELTAEVKFREECGTPKTLPCTIEFDKKDANFSSKVETYQDGEGETRTVEKRVLWVSKYTEGEYVDNSMNDFE